MFLLPRMRFAQGRESERLEQRVSKLQNALNECVEAASRRAHVSHEVTAVIAVIMLVLGVVIGVNRQPITDFVTGLAQGIGLAKKVPGPVDPEAAYQSGDYSTALRLARPLAEAGDARAQSVLGRLYQGGYAVPRDYQEAVRWLRSAAEQGDARAQTYLGVMFAEGQGVPKDYVQAADWYRRAADQGEPHAQYNLGILYATGEAGQVDLVSAYMWLSLASAQFPVGDARHRTAVTSRDLVAKMMTQDQMVEAQRRAREHWRNF